MTEEWQPFVGSTADKPQQQPIFYDQTGSPRMRCIIGSFLASVIFILLVSFIMIIVEAAVKNPLFVLLLISLVAFAQVEFFLVFFIYRGMMPRDYYWAIFVFGTFVIIESICTDIVIFTVKT